MILLRCPKFLRCLTADAGNFDRGHSLTSLPLPLAALSSLPTSARTQALLATLRRGDPCGRPPPHLLHPIRRGRRLPTVVPTDSRPLLCPPIGALPRNRLASSATGSASPISPTARTGFFPHSTAGHTGPALQGVALSGPGGQGRPPLQPIRRGRCRHRPTVPRPLQKSISLPGRRTE